MKVLLFLMVFLILGALFIISNNNLAMHQKDNIKKFSELYIEWMDQIYLNFRIITGQVIRLNWLPG